MLDDFIHEPRVCIYGCPKCDYRETREPAGVAPIRAGVTIATPDVPGDQMTAPHLLLPFNGSPGALPGFDGVATGASITRSAGLGAMSALRRIYSGVPLIA